MGSKSKYLSEQTLFAVLDESTFPTITNTYIGLWTTTLDNTSTGSLAGEVSSSNTGYARVVCDKDTWEQVADSSGRAVFQNGIAIEFDQATDDWGTITHFAILDAATDGNILIWSALSSEKEVTSGDTVRFAIGDVQIIDE